MPTACAASRFPSLKAHFSRALAANPDRLHLAAHSHHLWPDVSLAGQQEAWNDAATLWDNKWDRVFGEVIPRAQRHIAKHLGLARPQNIAFAPNTHEFLLRVLSALPAGRPPRVLTTDSEFHSLSRQMARLEEDGLVVLRSVPTRPFESFLERFCVAAREPQDLVIFSHVFFNSAWTVPDLEALVTAVSNSEALVVIDGYHGFMARPTNLGRAQDRAFYVAGCYKYAMAGEGAGFLYCPDGYAPRPRNTGWFASFGALSSARTGAVPYAADGGRFLGATFDPTGVYRLNAVMDWREGLALDVIEAHARVRALQTAFVEALEPAGITGLRAADLVVPWGSPDRGNFLAYDSPATPDLYRRLAAAGIVTDRRGTILRIGFGLYHDTDEVPAMVERIRAALN